jgi:hypothetical protein
MISLKRPLLNAAGAAFVLSILTLCPAAAASFQVVNTNADGSVITPSGLFASDPTSFDLIGGNNGSGLEGMTSYTGTATTAGLVGFLWSYTSCYPPNEQPASTACDSPGYDWTGYLVGQTLTPLTDTDTGGVTASASFAVSAGSVYGWYVGTFDNQGEPGTVTVSDVTFTPTTKSGTPEPGTLYLCLTCLAVVAMARRRITKNQLQNRRKV